MPRFDKPTRDEVLAKYEKNYMERLAADGKIELTEKMAAELAKNATTFDDYEKDYLARLESKENKPSESTQDKSEQTEDTQIEFKTDKSPGAMPKGWNPPTETKTVNLDQTISKVDNEIDELKKELKDLTTELESERKDLKNLESVRVKTAKPKKRSASKKKSKKKAKPKKRSSSKKKN